MLPYDEARMLKQRLATGVSCDGEMEQYLINASKDVLGYMVALHANEVMSQNNVRKSFRGSFTSLVQWIQTVFTQKFAAVSKSLNDSGRETIIEFCRSISECEVAAKGRLDRLVGGDCASPGAGAVVPEAVGTGGASGIGPAKQCLLKCVVIENLTEKTL